MKVLSYIARSIPVYSLRNLVVSDHLPFFFRMLLHSTPVMLIYTWITQEKNEDSPLHAIQVTAFGRASRRKLLDNRHARKLCINK